LNTILVINAGSSSIKFQLFAAGGERSLKRLLKGRIEGIGVKPLLVTEGVEPGMTTEVRYSAAEVPNVPEAMRRVGGWLREAVHGFPMAVGHRVVHGGPEFHQPVIVDAATLAKLERFVWSAHGDTARPD
jgi:acetate kinase